MTGTGGSPGSDESPSPAGRSGPRAHGAVGIDYTAAPGHAPGVGRYVRELVRALVRLEGAPDLWLVEFGRAPRPMEGAPLGLVGTDVRARVTRRRIAVPRRWLGAVDRIASAVATRGTQVFHRVDPERPLRPRAPTTLPLLEFPPDGTRAAEALAAAARDAAGVIAFSRTAAERIVRVYGVDAARVRTSPVGCEHWARDLGLGVGDELEALPRRATRDVLVLGAVRHARLPLSVLRGFEALRAGGTRARLLLVGRPGDAAAPFRAALHASRFAADVRWIDAPIEARMPSAVAGASVLLHLAEDEVSPVTPLEATRLGLPIVASDLPAFREALGPEGRWVDPDDPAGIARALGEALDEAEEPGTRARLAGLTRRWTWESAAIAHVALWESMLVASPGP